MQNNLITHSSVKVLIVMNASEKRNSLVENIQKYGLQPEISTHLPDILRKLNHYDKYDMMFISTIPDVNHSELISFIRSGLSGKCPHLIGISLGVSEIQQRIYLRIGDVNEYINSLEDYSKVANLLDKVHKNKFVKKRSFIPKKLVIA